MTPPTSQQLLLSTFDALGHHVALLDDTGTILAVNQSWHRFLDTNGPALQFHGKGQNYLALCDSATGEGADDARSIAVGIRTVLAGSDERFSLEYACHGPDDQRWFTAHVIRLAEEGPLRLAVVHEEVTVRKQAERRQSLQVAVSLALADSHAFSEAAPRILQAVCELMHWDLGEVWLTDQDCKTLRCEAIWHRAALRAEEFTATSFGMSFSPGQGLPGRVWESGSPAWIPDLARDPNFPRAGVAARAGLHAGFSFPIKSNWDTLGAIEFFSWRIRQPEPALLRMMGEIGGKIGQFVQRKRAETLAQQRQIEQEALLDLIPAMVWYKDTHNRILKLNKAAADSLGMTVREIEGRSVYDLYAEDAERYYRDDIEVIASRRPKLGIIEPLATKNGGARWIHTDKVPFHDAQGNVAGILVVAQDITELKRAEEAVRASEERGRAVIEAIPQQVWTARPDGALDYVNQRVLEYFACSPEEIIGQGWQSKLHPDDLPLCLERWSASLRTGEPYEIEFRLQRVRDGAYRWHLGRALPVRDASGRISKWFGTNTDITERRQLEEDLRQSQKMESVGRLAGGIAHDFNNILTAILGYADLLVRQLPPNHAFSRYAQEIKKSGDRAVGVTQQLLAFSRRQPAQTTLVDLNDLVIGMENLLHRLIGEDFALTLQLAPELGPVKADPRQIEQVLMNLVLNARDAMPDGGQLTVETFARPVDEAMARAHETARPGPYAVLAVSDQGQGMDEATIVRIFEPFFTTKAPGKGTGLGLSIVYGIVTQHDGFIDVRSQPWHGTRFEVYLPLAAQDPLPTVAPHSPAELLNGRETILLVEDEESVRSLAREMLTEAGYAVLEAGNGKEALTLVGAHRDPIHLLLTDVIMPYMGGPDLAAKLTEQNLDLPVLYMTGYANDSLRRIAATHSLMVLQKPFSQEQLLCCVRRSLDRPGSA